MNIKYYFKRVKQEAISRYFHYATRKVYDLPTVANFSEESNVIVLSMLQKKDVQMYLLAAKSMLRYLVVNKVVIVCDPSLTEQNKSLIKKHIQKVDFIGVDELHDPRIPVGGCWERLYAIAIFNSQYYVIQMDADILVMQKPEAVIEAIESNNPFVLATEKDCIHVPVEVSTKIAKDFYIQNKNNNQKTHIQVVAESLMMDLTKLINLKTYTRGCAGFCGFPRNTVTPEQMLLLSEGFYQQLKERWEEWGSEQFMSNVLLSAQENLSVLPLDQYDSSNRYTPQCVLAHFIGTYRFANDLYVKLAKKIINDLLI